jgi:phosphate transport system substrate-binding protein
MLTNLLHLADAGQNRYLNHQADYAVTTVPLNSFSYDILYKTGRVVLQIPYTMQLFAVVFNIPGFQYIEMDACTLAGIFSGDIQYWSQVPSEVFGTNATELFAPDQPVIPIVPAELNGITTHFTRYLNTTCPQGWSLGVGQQPTWPDGIARGVGYEGIISNLQATDYSISFLDYYHAAVNDIPYAAIDNLAGNFLLPQDANFTGLYEEFNATPGSAIPNTTISGAWDGASVGKSRLPTSYPFASFVFINVDQNLTDAGISGVLIKQLVGYFLSKDALDGASAYGFVPLPPQIRNIAIIGAFNITANATPDYGLPPPGRAVGNSSTTVVDVAFQSVEGCNIAAGEACLQAVGRKLLRSMPRQR